MNDHYVTRDARPGEHVVVHDGVLPRHTHSNGEEGEEGGGSYPLCPGMDEGSYCDGTGDCMNHPTWCECPDARQLCSVNGYPLSSAGPTPAPTPLGSLGSSLTPTASPTASPTWNSVSTGLLRDRSAIHAPATASDSPQMRVEAAGGVMSYYLPLLILVSGFSYLGTTAAVRFSRNLVRGFRAVEVDADSVTVISSVVSPEALRVDEAQV